MTWQNAVGSDESAERERQLWLAYQSRDRARIEAFIAPDAIDIGAGGILTRDEVLAAVGQMRIESFELDDVRVCAVGTDVEIVVSRSVVTGTYRGQPFPSSVVRATSVWARNEGAWRLVHRVECPETL